MADDVKVSEAVETETPEQLAAKEFAAAEAADLAAYKEEMKRLVNEVSANPGAIEFPSDQWGFTSDLKKIALLTASKVRGNEEKHRLLLGTLAVISAHIRKRYDGDKAHFEQRLELLAAAEEDRAPRQRQAGLAVSSALMGE